METFVVISYEMGDVNRQSHLVVVCDSLFIAKVYADTEAKSNRTNGCMIYSKIMNAPYTEMDAIVYRIKMR
tara:strand:+ start:291 stop:503 length:213 start_codon:yes stop_codon:yes gene_type:complete